MKGFGVGVAMSVFSQISGCFIIINYAVLVFKRTGTLLNINLSSILLAVAILLGPLTTSYFADKLGRKKLNFISMMGSSLGLLCMSLYSYLHLCGYDLSTFSVVPIICLSFVCFIASAGIIPLVVVCSIEYLPPNVRNFIAAIILIITMKKSLLDSDIRNGFRCICYKFSLFCINKNFPDYFGNVRFACVHDDLWHWQLSIRRFYSFCYDRNEWSIVGRGYKRAQSNIKHH